LSQAHTAGSVLYRPTPDRCRRIREELALFSVGDSISLSVADSLLGKLGFLSSALYNGVGRALIAPLRLRGKYPKVESTRYVWTPAMSSMRRALTALLQPGILPAREVSVDRSPAPHISLYTDASHSDDYSGLGVVLEDASTGTRLLASAAVPAWVLARLANPRWAVNQLEALALVCALLTFRSELAGRRVLTFLDNTSAMSSIIHGYSSRPDMAALVNMFLFASVEVGADMWLEYVPSKANPADIPSRPDHPEWPALRALGFRQVELVFPTEAEWDAPEGLLLRLRQLLAQDATNPP